MPFTDARETAIVTDAAAKRAAIEENLERNEVRIGALVEQMADIENRLAKHLSEVAELRVTRSITQSTLVHDREELMSQIKAAYSVGRQDYLKLLLNQEDPAAIIRGLTYHAVIQRHRGTELRVLYGEVQRITDQERVIDQRESELITFHKAELLTIESI